MPITLSLGTLDGADLETEQLPGGVHTQSTFLRLGPSNGLAEVSTADPLPVSGTVTANAGTDLNTSTLALETGGNLATIAGAVAAGEMQVDVVTLPVLPSGDNNIGNVDIVSLPNEGQQTMANSISVAVASDQGAVPVSGTITADAGTNLNTSALALETGGNLATLAGAVSGSEMQVDVVTLPSLPSGTNNIGDVDIVTLPPISGTVTANAGTDLNTSALALETGGNLATIAGSVSGNEMQVDVVTLPSLPSGTNNIGDVDIVTLPVGARTLGYDAHPTPVSNGNPSDAFADLLGRHCVQPYVPRELKVQNTVVLTTTSEITLIAAAASTFHDLVLILIGNSSGTLVTVDFRDATAGTVRHTAVAAANGGGAVVALPVQLNQAVANNNWTVQLSTAVSSVYITAIAIKHPG